MEYYWIIFLIIHSLYSTRITIKLIQSKKINKFQKKAHVVLTWLIPFIWGNIVKNLIKKRKFKTITKKDRKHKISFFGGSGGYGGRGGYGGGGGGGFGGGGFGGGGFGGGGAGGSW